MDGVEVTGTFNPTAFFETLAIILSQKYGANITVRVTQPAGAAGCAVSAGLDHGKRRKEAKKCLQQMNTYKEEST